MKSMEFVSIAVVIGGVAPASAQFIINSDQTLSGALEGARGGGYRVQSGTLTIDNGSMVNFRNGGAAGDRLTVTLNEGPGIRWGNDSFVPAGSALLSGSDGADCRVTFTNDIDLNGDTGTILVNAKGNPASDAVMTGVLSNGALVVRGPGYAGRRTLTAEHTYAGTTTVAQDATLLLYGNGGVAVTGGIQTLTGHNSDAGSTLVGNVTLAVNGDGALGAPSAAAPLRAT